MNCDICGAGLVHRDYINRKIKHKGGTDDFIRIERVWCVKCKKNIRRVLPDTLERFKQYESDIIEGVKEGFITQDTLGFENYPCEMTMSRWRNDTK